MNRSPFPRPFTLVAALALAVGLQSCIINARSHTTRSGKYVGAETLSQIEPGQSQEYVVALIGEPTSKTALSDGTAIWRWSYREKKTSGGSVVFLIDTDSADESERSTYVQFENGAVSKKWQD